MNDVTGGLFGCEVDPDAIGGQILPLFPDKVQEWLMVFPEPENGTREGLLRMVGAWFSTYGEKYGLDPLGAQATVEQIEVKETTRNRPPTREQMPGVAAVSIFAPMVAKAPAGPDKPVLYVGVTFHYNGAKTETRWPWEARGFSTRCPEDFLGGVYAAFAPSEKPKEVEKPGLFERVLPGLDITTPAKDVVNAASSVSKAVLWVGGAIVLFKLVELMGGLNTGRSRQV